MPSDRKKKRNVFAEPSSAAGIALIVHAVAQVVAQGAEAVAGAGGDWKAAAVPVVTGLLGLLAVFMPEGKSDAGS